MNSSTMRSTSGSMLAGGLVASLLSALAVFLVTSTAPLAHRSTYLFSRHVTFSNVIFAAVFAVLWQSCGILIGLYGRSVEGRTSGVTKALQCSIAMTVLLGLCMALTAARPPVVRVMGAFFVCAIACELTRLGISRLLCQRSNRVVIVGCDRLAAKAWREFRVHRDHHIHVVGFVDRPPSIEMMPDMSSRYLGGLEDLSRIILVHDVDDVIVATSIASHSHNLGRAISEAASLGARILCLKDVCGIHPETVSRDYGEILFELAPGPRLDGLEHASKRAFDVTVSLVVLLFGSSLLLPVAVLSLLQWRPVVYQSQVYLGFRRRKYRRWCLSSAPRGLRVNLLLDILPNMWSVVLGHMSLVGPKPVLEAEIQQAKIATLAGRFNVQPGVIGRPICDPVDSTFAPYMHDVTSWSLRTDLKALVHALRTTAERSAAMETGAGAL